MGTVAVTFDDYSTLTVTKTLTMVYEKKKHICSGAAGDTHC